MGLRVWAVIVVVGVLTFSIRGSFLLFASRFEGLPEGAREVLRMIPPAALAALVAPALLRVEGSFTLVSAESLAGVVALAVAWWSRNVLITILVGLGAVVAFGLLMS